MHFVFTSDICAAIRVTGDTSTSHSEGGLYHLSDERSSLAPNSPVWKNGDGSRYIFNTGGTEGWRIAPYSSLATGSYTCQGKHILMTFTIASTYRTRAIITRGLYTFYPLFEVHLCTVTFGIMYS